MIMNKTKNIILSIREVEPGLVEASRKISKNLSIELEGLVIVSSSFVSNDKAQNDESGFFKQLIVDFDDPLDIERKLAPYADRILAVNCRFETAVQNYIKVIPFLSGIPTPTQDSLRWSTEKKLMRDKLKEYDESIVPKYSYLQNLPDKDELNRITSEMSFPLIVKPNGLYSSMLVTKCENFESLQSVVEKTFDVINKVYAKERGAGKPSLLIEEFISGDMYSIDAYVSENGEITCLPPVRVITSHDVGLDGFYGYQFELPATLDDAELIDAYETAKSSVKALELTSCTAHIELYNTKNGWKIIELAPRIGGHREDLYREAYGIDHYYNDLASRTGLPLDLPREDTSANFAVCMDLYPEKEGIITGFEGFEEIKKLKSFVHVITHAKVGDEALFAQNGGPYIVDVMLSHSDKQQVLRDADKVRQTVLIKVI
jgi:biotin carboxylase